MKKFFTLLLLCACGTFPRSASAQVFIKPTGKQAIPLRVQKLKTEVEIYGGIAITHWEMTLQMENVGFGSYWRSTGLCEFIVARPPDAKVTAFTVGDNDALIGRVVEKSLAVPRATFKASPRDPLVKSHLTARNSFRSILYPVGPLRQMTLKGTWVQVVPTVANLSTFRLPLLSLKGVTTRLSRLDIKVTVHDNTPLATSCNYGQLKNLPDHSSVLSISQKNFRIVRDLTLARKIIPMRAVLLTAPGTPGELGHLALTFVADRNLKGTVNLQDAVAKTTIGSAKVTVKKGGTFVIASTYNGDSNAISLQVEFAGTLLNTPFTRYENAIAAPLWATQRINELGNLPSNRAEVTALSKKFSVVSPYTAWLTVDRGDLKYYSHALVSAQLDPLVREYWMRYGLGQEKTARSVRLKNTIAKISKLNGLNLQDELYMRLGEATSYASWADFWSVPEKKKSEKRILRLNAAMQKYVQEIGVKPSGNVSDPQYRYYSNTRDELGNLRGFIMNEYRQPHPNYAKLQDWEHRFAQLYGSLDIDPRLRFWTAQVTAHDLEEQTYAAEKAGDGAKLKELANQRIDNSRQAYFTNNIGDPPIYVSAPADCLRVVAVMPNGQIKTLDYDQAQKRWEGNYDVPTTTQDGDFSIRIVIVDADQTRRSYAMRFRVDTQAPTGIGRAVLQSSATQQPLNQLSLEVEHGGDAARVTALLPWGEKVAMLPSTTRGQAFFANVTVPASYAGKAITVSYIITDCAHNRTVIESEALSQLP